MYNISADSLLIITNLSSCLPLASRVALEGVGPQLVELALALALVFVVGLGLLALVVKQQVLVSEEHLRPLRSLFPK